LLSVLIGDYIIVSVFLCCILGFCFSFWFWCSYWNLFIFFKNKFTCVVIIGLVNCITLIFNLQGLSLNPTSFRIFIFPDDGWSIILKPYSFLLDGLYCPFTLWCFVDSWICRVW